MKVGDIVRWYGSRWRVDSIDAYNPDFVWIVPVDFLYGLVGCYTCVLSRDLEVDDVNP